MEFAVLLPIVLLIGVGSVLLALAMTERLSLTHAATEGARSAAEAATDAERCDAARAAIEAVTGQYFGNCAGDPGRLAVVIIEGEPRAVRVTIDGSTWAIPFLEPIAVSAEAGAIIREEEDTP